MHSEFVRIRRIRMAFLEVSITDHIPTQYDSLSNAVESPQQCPTSLSELSQVCMRICGAHLWCDC